jgi:hypothetical protein
MDRLTARSPKNEMAYLAKVKTNEQVLEIEKAKADGRLLVIPDIKKGKTIYWIWGSVVMPCKFIRPYAFNGGGKVEIGLEVKTKKDWQGGTKRYPHIYKAGDRRYLPVSEIGKTVFLNREDITNS